MRHGAGRTGFRAGHDVRAADWCGAGTPPLLAVAHGTRDPSGTATTEALLDRVRELRPGLRVVLAYVDVARPSLTDVLAELSGEVVLVPLLLGTGFHIRVDIPEVLAAAPQVEARVARALGPDPLLASALADRLAEAREPSSGPVVLASAGSTDPVSQRAAVAMADLLAEQLGRPAVASYLCAGSPTPADALAALRAQGHRDVTVASYLMTPGFFARRAAEAADTAGSVVSAPLGAHGAVARLIVDRYEEAAARPGTPVERASAAAG